VDYLKLKKHLEENGYAFDFQKDTDKTHFRQLYHAITGEGFNTSPNMDRASFSYNMSIDAFFNLIEYKELKEAREASKIAMKRSTIAIAISIFSMAMGAALSIYQLSTPTILDLHTIDELKVIKYDDTTVKKHLESIDKYQKTIIDELRSISILMKNANKQLNKDAAKNAAPVN